MSSNCSLHALGVPGVIPNLEVRIHCLPYFQQVWSNFQLFWESPPYFDVGANDEFCVYISDTTDNSLYKHVQCGLSRITYNITIAPEKIECANTLNFTVVGVNWAGQHGPSLSVFQAGIIPVITGKQSFNKN